MATTATRPQAGQARPRSHANTPLCAALALIARHRREHARRLAAAIRQHQQPPRQAIQPAGRQQTSVTGQETTP